MSSSKNIPPGSLILLGGLVGLIALQLIPRPCVAPFLTALVAVGILLLVLDNR